LIVADLYEAGTLGIQEEDLPGAGSSLRAYFDDAETAARLAGRLGECSPVVEPGDDHDWVSVWQSRWSPVEVGERFFLVPEWCDDRAPAGRLRLRMPPGTAFGTGLHPSTQLMLAALERRLRPGDRLLDLGTGSGILSAAAAMLGAGKIFACDIEEEAASAARRYVPSQVAVFTGSVRSLQSASMDVVAANLNAPAISQLASELARVVSPGGCVIAGGITAEDGPRLIPRLLDAGLLVDETLKREEWICQILRPRSADAAETQDL
jgi:ribosomal protein L11 methyltransferase